MTRWTRSPAPALVFGLVASPAVAWVAAGMVAHQFRGCYGHLDASSAVTANAVFFGGSTVQYVVGAVAVVLALCMRRVEQAFRPARVMIAVMGGAILLTAIGVLTVFSPPTGTDCPTGGYGASAALTR